MSSLFIHRAACIATQDDAGTELFNASLLLRDGRVARIFTENESVEAYLQPGAVDEVIDARHHVVTPGLVNTHHHMVKLDARSASGAKRRIVFVVERFVSDLGGPYA